MARGGVEAFDTETGDDGLDVLHRAEDGPRTARWSGRRSRSTPPGGTVFAATGNNYTWRAPTPTRSTPSTSRPACGKWKKQVRAERHVVAARRARRPRHRLRREPDPRRRRRQEGRRAGDKGSAFWALDRATGDIDVEPRGPERLAHQANGGVLDNGALRRHVLLRGVEPVRAARRDPARARPGADGRRRLDARPSEVTWGAPSIANGVLFVPVDADLYVFERGRRRRHADDVQHRRHDRRRRTRRSPRAASWSRAACSTSFDGASTNNNQIICYGLP